MKIMFTLDKSFMHLFHILLGQSSDNYLTLIWDKDGQYTYTYIFYTYSCIRSNHFCSFLEMVKFHLYLLDGLLTL